MPPTEGNTEPPRLPEIQDPQGNAAQQTGDANEGIDEDGGIQRGQLPTGLNHPERWRFIPEGRLIEGTVGDRLWVSTFVFPIYAYSEDVGSVFGVNFSDLNFGGSRRKEFLNVIATVSTEGQRNFAAFWRSRPEHYEVDGGGVVFEENSAVSVGGGYNKTLTRRFFGLGADSPESAETSYSNERSAASFGFTSSFPQAGDDFVYDVNVIGEHRGLSSGHVTDIPSTDVAFPTLFADGDSYDMLTVKAAARYDTLDSPKNPYHGFSAGGEVDFKPVQSHNNVGVVAAINAEWAHEVPSPFHNGGRPGEENPPTDTVAIGGFVQSASGNLPFWSLPSLGGGKTQRGYIANRFTDRAAWHVATEYRFWPISRGVALSDTFRIERMGAAIFYEAGTVARRLDRLGSATIKQSYGFSLRMTLERTALFRIDFGLSDEGAQTTLGFGLSF